MSMLEFAKHVCKKAGDKLMKYFYSDRFSVSSKKDNTKVTSADVEIENYVRKEIERTFPTHGFLGEETGSKDGWPVWVLDPLDGTGNFIKKIGFFSISLALKEDDVVLGVVYDPVSKEMFWGEKGKGSFVNEKKLPLQKPSNNAGFCYINKKKSKEIASAVFSSFIDDMEFRKYGCASLEICYVAAGRLRAFLGIDVKVWDYYAGMLIAKEAGCYAGLVNINGIDVFYVSREPIEKRLLELF